MNSESKGPTGMEGRRDDPEESIALIINTALRRFLRLFNRTPHRYRWHIPGPDVG